MLFNKKLNITDEDISIQSDISVLTEWRNSVNIELVDAKRRLLLAENPDEMKRIETSRFYLVKFQMLLENRIKQLKYDSKKDVLLMRKFMKVAKEVLTKEQYEDILEKAKEISNYNQKD